MAGGDKKMTTKKVILSLSSEDTSRFTRIVIDGDKEEALLFLKECIKPQVDQATREQ